MPTPDFMPVDTCVVLDGPNAYVFLMLSELWAHNGPDVQSEALTPDQARAFARQVADAADEAERHAREAKAKHIDLPTSPTGVPQVSRDTCTRMRESAKRLRRDYPATRSHDKEAAEIEALAAWLDANRTVYR